MRHTRYELLLVGAVILIGAAIGVPALRRSTAAARRAECMANLNLIGQALQQYVQSNHGAWPHVAKLPSVEYHTPHWPSLPEVLKPHMSGPATTYRCPGDHRELPANSPLAAHFSASTTYYETEGTSYEWVFEEMVAGQKVGRDPLARSTGLGIGPADQPVIWEFGAFHEDDRGGGPYNVLYADFKARAERASKDHAP